MKDDTPFILECPGCQTRYEIPVSIPEGGRKVRCVHCTHVWIAQPGDEFRLGDPPSFDEEQSGGDVVFRDQESFDGAPADAEPEEAARGENTASPAVTEEQAADMEAAGQQEARPPDTEETADETAAPVEDRDSFMAALAEAESEQRGAAEAGDESDVASLPGDTGETAETATGLSEAEKGDAAEAPGPGHDAVEEFYGEPGEAGAVAESADHASERIVIGKAKRRSGVSVLVAAGWAGLVLTVAAFGAFAVNQRVAVVEALPGSAPVFAALGMPVNIRGLDFRDVAYSWENDGGQVVLEVHGDIVNVTGMDKAVPSLVLALRDDTEKEVYQWEEEVMKEPLAAGASATFAVRIPTPPKSIDSVQVRFARAR